MDNGSRFYLLILYTSSFSAKLLGKPLEKWMPNKLMKTMYIFMITLVWLNWLDFYLDAAYSAGSLVLVYGRVTDGMCNKKYWTVSLAKDQVKWKHDQNQLFQWGMAWHQNHLYCYTIHAPKQQIIKWRINHSVCFTCN